MVGGLGGVGGEGAAGGFQVAAALAVGGVVRVAVVVMRPPARRMPPSAPRRCGSSAPRSTGGHHGVPQGVELCVARNPGHAGDPSGGQAHHPFGQSRREAWAVLPDLGRDRRDLAGQALPASNGSCVGLPVDVRALIAVLRSAPPVPWRPAPFASDTVGVGSSAQASAARHSPCVPASCDGERFVCRFSLADALGVGRSRTAAEGSIRSPEDPRWLGPPFVPSVALGVGTPADSEGDGRSASSRPSLPPRFQSRELAISVSGFGSTSDPQDEQALALVRRADVGCCEDLPVGVVAKPVEIAEDDVEPEIQVVGDVLEHDERRAQGAHGCGDERPDVPRFPTPCRSPARLNG